PHADPDPGGRGRSPRALPAGPGALPRAARAPRPDRVRALPARGPRAARAAPHRRLPDAHARLVGSVDPVAALRRLERLRSEYGGGAAARKPALLETLAPR